MPACLISASTDTPAKQPLPLLMQVFKSVGNKFKNTWWLPFCKALNGYSEGEQGSGSTGGDEAAGFARARRAAAPESGLNCDVGAFEQSF
jgi:hypothetical protein